MSEQEHTEEALEAAIDGGDGPEAARIVENMMHQELAHAIGVLESRSSVELLGLVSARQAAEVLHRIPEPQAADLIDHLDRQDAASVMEALPRREQADLLIEIGGRGAREILDAMEPETAESIRDLTAYPEGTAGALLDPEVIAFEESTPVAAVVKQLQQNAARYRDFQILYLHVTREGRLCGVVPLRDLVLSEPDLALAELVRPGLQALPVEASLEDMEAEFDENSYMSLPVTGVTGELLGLVHRSDLEHELAERSQRDYRRSKGIVGREELRSMPYGLRARRRLSWLSINVMLNLIAASVIAAYQETLSAVIALAAFLPIISDMSGCSGNQAVAVSMRELSLGIIGPKDAWRVWRKEAGVALINGVALGALLGGVAYLWQRNLVLSGVVAAALAINTVVAVSIGGVVPLILKKFQVDPAVASGPILTTVTDMCGFFLTLSMATLWLTHLT